MEITLIAVTILSLFLAISMGVVAWRLVQEERRRSEARLAALAAELREGEGVSTHQRTDPLVLEELPAAPGATGRSAAGAAGMFSSPVESTATGWGRLAAIGGGAVTVVAAVTAAFLLSGSDDGDGAATTERVRPRLDLIALEHAEEGPFLDISGSVRNPPEADALQRLSVVAMAFDDAGTLIATRRTPVEPPALSAGADSAFVVRLLAAGIRRYRISFLLGETTIPHIDRRPAVQPPAPTGDSS